MATEEDGRPFGIPTRTSRRNTTLVIIAGDNFSMLPAYVNANTLLYFVHIGCIYLTQDLF